MIQASLTSAATSVRGRAAGLDARLVVALLLLAAFCAMALARVWSGFPADLSALFMAGHLYATGQADLIYAAPPGFFNASPAEWTPLLPALGLADQYPLPYVYPPLWAALFAPLSTLGAPAFFQVFAVVEIAMLAASVVLAWRLCRAFAIPLWAWILLSTVLMASSVITFTALIHLQPQIIVVFLILLAFERYSAGNHATAGAILAIAALLKLAPAALILIFILDRNWRALATFALTCAIFITLSLTFMGPDLHRDFLTSMAAASAGVFVTTVNFSFELVLHGLSGGMDLTAKDFTLPDNALFPAITKATLIISLLWVIFKTNALPETHRLPARLLLLTVLINLFGPLSWAHYYLPQLFLLPALIGLLPKPQGAILCAGVAIATSWAMLLIMNSQFSGDFPFAALGATTMFALFILVTARVRA